MYIVVFSLFSLFRNLFWKIMVVRTICSNLWAETIFLFNKLRFKISNFMKETIMIISFCQKFDVHRCTLALWQYSKETHSIWWVLGETLNLLSLWVRWELLLHVKQVFLTMKKNSNKAAAPFPCVLLIESKLVLCYKLIHNIPSFLSVWCLYSYI